MSSQSEILDHLVGWASGSDTIRAMWLTGSRADPNRTPDALSDFDVGMCVHAVRPFIDDDAWINRFGTPMVRWPEQPSPTFSDNWITQLVQYESGLRIDFQITELRAELASVLDTGYRILLDKDDLFSSFPPERSPQFRITAPDEKAFQSRLNAFWWDILYVPKALLRGELNLAKYMLDDCIRFEHVQPLIAWYIGLTFGWEINCGIHGRWFKRLLPKDLWMSYLKTFAGSGIEENWVAVFATVKFVRRIATEIASKLSFRYPEGTDASVTAYVDRLRHEYSGEFPDD